MCAKEEIPQPAVDDVWGDDSDDETHTERTQLDREWAARHQQFYNTGYREGTDEGKELTLQLGFNAGFNEGAQAGFEYGAIKGALQTLAVMYLGPQETANKIQELLQQVNALPNHAVMRDTCMALLQQPVAGAAADNLQQQLQQLQLEDGIQPPDASAATASTLVDPSTSGAARDRSSDELQPGSSLPQQLVTHLRRELLSLGVDVQGAPARSVTAAETRSEAAAAIAAADDDAA